MRWSCLAPSIAAALDLPGYRRDAYASAVAEVEHLDWMDAKTKERARGKLLVDRVRELLGPVGGRALLDEHLEGGAQGGCGAGTCA